MDLDLKEEYIARAVKLHKDFPCVDAHLDLAGEILLRKKLGETRIIHGRYLENWKKAGIKLVVSSVYTPTKILEERGSEGAWEDALAQIEALKEEIEAEETLMPVRNRGELAEAVSGGNIGILMYMEGIDCIGQDLSRLKILSEMGVRGASLTWSRENALARGCCSATRRRQIIGGLTKTGKEAVEEMERLSMFLDVSHLNDDGFEDIKAVAKRPFCATHSCARSVYDNYRNLTDEQMLALAQRGGVMGLNGCKYIAGSLAGNHLEMLCAHAEYEVKKAGASHVGFGFDLCDPYERAAWELSGRKSAAPSEADCLKDHGQIPLFTAALLQRGMEEEKAAEIMGENFIRYFQTVLP